MIPKPPFAADLTPERELAEFERLKLRLPDLWNALTAREEEPYTSVVVPSMTLDPDEIAKIEAADFYEERLLFLLIRLRNPHAHMVYVTSRPVHPLILDYYLHLLAGVPASHARSRLTLLCAHDSSPKPLTQKILDRPRLIQRIRYGIPDASRAFLTVFNATPIERTLAVLLGIPLNGVDPELRHWGTKSGGRRIFREAGVTMPEGSEDIHTPEDVVSALTELERRRPGVRRAVVKLNEGFSGEGNATFTFPKAEGDRKAMEKALRTVRYGVADERFARFFEKLQRMGGVVEEHLEGTDVQSPSAQLRIDPQGGVVCLSTHDQILGGPNGHVFLGCRFPAGDDYRLAIQDAACRIGQALARHGVVSRFGVDFLARRAGPGEPWSLHALEINLRIGGTTHPFLALQFLTGGCLDPATSLFHSPRGTPLCYRSTDNLKSDAYRGLLPEDLLDLVAVNRLQYDHVAERGILFHMMGAVSQYGKLGMTAIASSHAEVDAIYDNALAVLDRETAPIGTPRVARKVQEAPAR